MFSLKRNILGAACCMVALALSAPSYATKLIADSGWQEDQITSVQNPTLGSPVTFTIGKGQRGVFSLSDGFVAGDVYTVMVDGLMLVNSTFSDYATPFVNNFGPAAADFATDWTDSVFSHLQLTFLPGSHSLIITGNGAGGLPAHVGERLDILGIPEPASWLTMLLGFGGLGLSMRRQRARNAVSATA